jgi:hypothetical protein
MEAELLRSSELEEIIIASCNNFSFMIVYSSQHEKALESTLNICRTLFSLILLVWQAWVFQKDSTKILIEPIERMIETVRMLARNPLIAS